MTTNPETVGRQGGTQASEDEAKAIEGGELPRGWRLFVGGNARDDDGTTRGAPRTVNVPPEGDNVKNSIGGEEKRRENGRTSGAS